jgi:acyl-lipid omega-6 desaturase (Delta-12 desaturase)
VGERADQQPGDRRGGGALGSFIGWHTLLLVHLPIVLIAGPRRLAVLRPAPVRGHLLGAAGRLELLRGGGPRQLVLRPAAWLHWWTGNIGYHHIHHLASKVPNYRLRECFESSQLLQKAPRLESFRCARLKLWDEEARRLVPFRKRQPLHA